MKKMLSATVLMLALVAARSAGAQDWWLGARGGPSMPQLSGGGNEVSRDYQSILAPNLGLMVERTFNRHFSLLLEIEYSQQGGERKGMQPITQDIGLPPHPLGYYYADFKNRSELDYLEIPLLAKYEWALDDEWRIFAEGGPYVGFLMSAEQKTSGNSLIYADSQGQMALPIPPQPFDANANVRDDLNTVNAGIMAGLGIGYLLDPSNMIYFDVRGEYGLTTLQKDTERNGSSHTGCATFLFGYKHRFGV